VLQQAPYDLTLREAVGGHPLDGGVLVFDLPGPIVAAAGALGATANPYWVSTHQQLEARQVQVTLRAVPGGGPGAPERTLVTMTADLRPGVRRNVRASQWTAASMAGFTGVLTGAVLAKGAALVVSAAVLGPAAGVAAAAAGLSLLTYRRLYPSVLAKAEGEMRRALEAVAGAVRSEAVFGTLPGPATRATAVPAGNDADVSSLLVM
jgi:hypothetical protein